MKAKRTPEPGRVSNSRRSAADRKYGKRNPNGMSGLPDYRKYRLSPGERLIALGMYALLDAAVSILFYRSIWIFLCLLPGFVLFLKERRKTLMQRRSAVIRSQFLTAMQLVSTSLQTGYAVENAFREALTELRKIYDEDSFAVTEFRHIVTQLRLNATIETLLSDLGERTGEDEIRSFSEVFLAAKRTGGDIMSVIRNTVSAMRQREETHGEIETVIAGKKAEQNIMSSVPLLILAYVTLTSPESLNGMYHTPAGIVVMTVSLLLYSLGYLWGRKIMMEAG